MGTFSRKAKSPAQLPCSPRAAPPPRGSQFPFDLFKTGAQCVAPVRADPFLLVTEACKMDQPHFSCLASGAWQGLAVSSL